MAGQIKSILEQIILFKSLGDPMLQKMTKVKLLIKGIQVDDFNDDSPDDPAMIAKLCDIVDEFGLTSGYFEQFKQVEVNVDG